jgi:putative salt-induced outer membrane protein YdiY
MASARIGITLRVWIGCLVFGAAILSPSVNAKVTRKDLVIMKNGDRLSGNVKKLENGVLYIETVYLSNSIGLDWLQVESIQSIATYQITLVSGRRLMGTIEKLAHAGPQDKNFVIREPGSEVKISAGDVAGIDQQKSTFLRQLAGSINASYGFTSGNSQSSATIDANASYSTTKWLSVASLSESFNSETGASKTNRSDLQFGTERFLNRDSFMMGIADFLHSSQQDLDLRTTLGGGYGRYIVRKGDKGLSWVTGVVYTNERFSELSGQTRDNNVEALIGLKYASYRFNFGQIQSQLFVFPGLSDFGRIRMTTNNTLTIALTNKFQFTTTFWDNFDSRPPRLAKKNEMGVSTGIGWSF